MNKPVDVRTVPAGLIAVLVLMCVLGSCTTFVMVPQEDRDTDVRYQRGDAYAVSEREGLALFSFSAYQGKQLLLQFTIANTSEDGFLSVDEGSFRLFQAENELGPWTELPVWEAREYFRRRKTQIRTAQVLTVLSASLQSASAGYSSGTVSGYSSNGTYYSARYTSYDSTLAAIEQRQIANTAAGYIEGGEAELAWLDANLLFPSQVQAGQAYTGVLFADSGVRNAPWYRLEYSIEGRRDEIIIFRDEY
jgi:hypothetical protein